MSEPEYKVECKGQDQVIEKGGELVFEAVIRDNNGQPEMGLPVKFVQVKGGGVLEQSDPDTNHCGEVCGILYPDGKTKRGRVELRYGKKLEFMVPFLYVVDGAQEEEAAPLPKPADPAHEEAIDSLFTAPVIEERTMSSDLKETIASVDRMIAQTAETTAPVTSPAAHSPAPKAVRPSAKKPATKQVRKGTSFLDRDMLQIAVMVGFIIAMVSLLAIGATKRLKPQKQAKVDLIVDCSKAPPAKKVGNVFVRDCQLWRQ